MSDSDLKLDAEHQAKRLLKTVLLCAAELDSDQIKNWKLGKGDRKTKFVFDTWSVIGSTIMADPEKYGLPANIFHIYDFQI